MRAPTATLLFSLGASPACGTYGLTPLDTGGGGDGTSLLDVLPVGDVEFGDASPYGDPIAQRFEMTPTGDTPVAITNIYLDKYTPSAFSIPALLDFPLAVQPSQTKGFDVEFMPNAAGHFGGLLVIEIQQDQSGATVEVTRKLTGTGCADYAPQDGICG